MNYINEAKLNKILTIIIIVLTVFIIACTIAYKGIRENSKQELQQLKENNYRYSNVEDEVKLGYANLKSNENND